jgi:hypothetical protein
MLSNSYLSAFQTPRPPDFLPERAGSGMPQFGLVGSYLRKPMPCPRSVSA